MQQVFRTDAAAMLKAGARWMGSLLTGGAVGPPKSLLDNAPLRELLSRVTDFDAVRVNVARGDLRKILAQHVELYEAMLRLHARRIRQLYGLVEDLNTLPLRARLAKQLMHLVRSYGVPSLSDGREVRIGLQLAQEELAQLLGASRQRVNQELKAMEREEAIRIEPGGLVVLDRAALMRISEAAEQ